MAKEEEGTFLQEQWDKEAKKKDADRKEKLAKVNLQEETLWTKGVGQVAKEAAQNATPQWAKDTHKWTKDKVSTGVNAVKSGAETVGNYTDVYTPTLKKGVKGIGKGIKWALGGLGAAGLWGLKKGVGKAKSQKQKLSESEDKKYKKILLFGILIWVLPYIVDVSSTGLRTSYMFLNILMIFYTLDLLGPTAIFAAILTFLHTEIVTIAGLAGNTFFLSVFWPWWVLFAYYTRTTTEKGFSKAITSLALVYFVIFVIAISGMGEQISAFGQSEEVALAREDQLEDTKKVIANPMYCTWRSLWYGENYYDCMHPPEEEEKKMTVATSKRAKGLVFRIKKSSVYPLAETIANIDPISGYQIALEYGSAIEEIPVEMSCFFKPSEKDKKTIKGSVDSYASFIIPKIEDTDYPLEAEIVCRPIERLGKGKYTAEFVFYVKDVTTTSILTKVFVGDEKLNKENKDKLIQTLVLGSCPECFQNGIYVPFTPAEEFASLVFFIGQPPTYPIISNIRNPAGDIDLSFSYSITNNQVGKIKEIKRIEIDMIPGITKKSEETCSEWNAGERTWVINEYKSDFSKITKNKKTRIATCQLKIDETDDLGIELTKARKEPKDIEGRVTYSYTIEKKYNVRVGDFVS